jgi:predicted protein tyrosine phosphatase
MQTPIRRVLFICRHNRMRSATAERIFAKREDLDVRSAGTSADALARVNAQMLDWADQIFIMDGQQRRALQRRFAGHPALERLICLDIPDEFGFLQPELVQLLEARAVPHLTHGPERDPGPDPRLARDVPSSGTPPTSQDS